MIIANLKCYYSDLWPLKIKGKYKHKIHTMINNLTAYKIITVNNHKIIIKKNYIFAILAN